MQHRMRVSRRAVLVALAVLGAPRGPGAGAVDPARGCDVAAYYAPIDFRFDCSFLSRSCLHAGR
jgi:hypothetical protein